MTEGADLAAALGGLARASRHRLAEQWVEYFGPPPPRTSRALLLRAVAYKLQEGALGGLSARTRARSGAAAGSSPAPCCCANGTGSRIRSGFSTMACSIRASAIAPCPRSPAGSPAPAGRGRASSASSHDDEDAGSALRRLHPQILRRRA